MRRVVRVLVLTALAASTLTGCGDSTGPEPQFSLHLVNLAPGIGAVRATLDGQVWKESLAPADTAAEFVAAGSHILKLTGDGSTLGTTVTMENGAAGVLLVEEGILTYTNTFEDYRDAKVVLINATSEVLDITMVGRDSQAGSTLQPGGAGDTPLSPGTFAVDVLSASSGTSASVDTVTLAEGRSFVVVYPTPDGVEPWGGLGF